LVLFYAKEVNGGSCISITRFDVSIQKETKRHIHGHL
jgi:hypothetical protein